MKPVKFKKRAFSSERERKREREQHRRKCPPLGVAHGGERKRVGVGTRRGGERTGVFYQDGLWLRERRAVQEDSVIS